MSSVDCGRWIELADQAALGGRLTDKDLAWLSQHASVCPDCGAEKQFYASLGGALGRPEALLVPAVSAATPRRRLGARRPLLLGLALAAGLVLVVGGPALLRWSRPAVSRVPIPLPPPASTAQVLFASADARLGLVPAQAGQQVPSGEPIDTGLGQACVGVAASIQVCLDAGSVASLASEPNRIVVTLAKGAMMARLDHQPPGRTFIVRTAGAEVQAVGTRFSVRWDDDGNTRVRLYEGRLAVRAASRVSTELAAPVQASIAQEIRVASLPAAEADEDKLLVNLIGMTRSERGAPFLLKSTPSGADVLLDNVPMGKTPISMFLPKAVHLQLSSPGHEPASDWIEVNGPTLVERTFTLSERPASPPSMGQGPAHAGTRTSPLSPDRLLARAQALRAHGRYNACARIYRRLWSEFPGSEEAKVSMISLGELELVQRQDPGSALTAFDGYLRLGGPLEREARYGKIRALHALNRREQAEVETARFLSDYPTSTQASTLRQQSHGP